MKKSVIVCVDDEELVLNTLSEQLRRKFKYQFEIETSHSAEEAVELIKAVIDEGKYVPVVLVDYLMPGKKGDELIRDISDIDDRILCILLTGFASLEALGSALNFGNLFRYIPKPWEENDLIMTVQEAYRRFAQERVIEEQNIELAELNKNLEKKVEERTSELEEANRTKDKFISILAHDLINPFHTMMGITQSISQLYDKLPDEKKVNYMKELDRQLRSTYMLFENLLLWTRSQSGKLKADPRDLNLEDITEREVSSIEQGAGNKGITIERNINESLMVYADENMLRTVLRNLITNAVKFTNKGGTITISAEEHENQIRIIVKDTGIGMSDEKLKDLFSQNDKVLQKGTDEESGSGLGLALCKEFTEQMGGYIHAESKEGEGSEFFVILPKNG